VAKTLGELAVVLSAKTQSFQKSFEEATQKVAEFADEVEEVASKGAAALGDISDGFLTVAAAATGAFILGAQGNREMTKASKDLQDATRALAVEFGKDLVPLVKEITTLIKTAVATYRNLSQGQREAIVSSVKWAFILGTGAKALERSIIFGKSFFEMTVAINRAAGPMSKGLDKAFTAISTNAAKAGDAMVRLGKMNMATIGANLSASTTSFATSIKAMPAALSGAAASFKAMAVAAAPVIGTVLAVAAAVMGLVLLAAVLRDAWAKSGDGIMDWLSGIADSAIGLGKTIATFIGDMFSSLTGFLRKGVEVAFELIASQIRWISKMAAPVAKFLGADKVAGMFQEMSATSGRKMLEYLEKGAKTLWDAGELAASAAMTRVNALAGAAGDLAKEGAAFGKDILQTSLDSIKNGLNLIDQDLGITEKLQRLKASFSDAVPDIGDPNTVAGVGTLDEVAKRAEDAKKAADELAKAIQGVQGGLLEAALIAHKWNMDASQRGLAAVRSVTEGIVGNVLKTYDRLQADAKALAERVAAAKQALSGMVLGRSGDAVSVVESGINGAALGGPMGAVGAVVLDLLTRSEQFQGIIEMVNNVVQLLADTLGRLLTSLGPVIAAALNVAVVLVQALQPALLSLSGLIEPLAPVLIMLGMVLAPLFSILGEMLGLLIKVLEPIVNVVLRGLFEVLRGLGIIVLNIVVGLGKAWNGIIGAIQKVFRSLADIEVFGVRPLGFLDGWANSLEQARIDTTAYAKMLVELKGMTWEAAVAKAKELEQTYKNVKAQQALNEELLNAPRAWRIALNRYRAQDGQGGMPSAPPATPTAPSERPPERPRNPKDDFYEERGPRSDSGVWKPPTKEGGWASNGNAASGSALDNATATVINITTYDQASAAREVQRILGALDFRKKATAT
jgi:hypothetical protein